MRWLIVLSFLVVGCATSSKRGSVSHGRASWYGKFHQGKQTANGELFDMHKLTAAHRTLPFGTRLRVSCPATGKEVQVRVNDRGPYAQGRILDLSRAAAEKLGIIEMGEAEIEYVVLP